MTSNSEFITFIMTYPIFSNNLKLTLNKKIKKKIVPSGKSLKIYIMKFGNKNTIKPSLYKVCKNI